MTVLVNKIYMNGGYPKDDKDVTKELKHRNAAITEQLI